MHVDITGGHVDNPTYEQVCSGRTGHTEAIELTYNPDEASSEMVMHRLYAHAAEMDGLGMHIRVV